MAIWLNLVGIPSPVPSLATTPLITHVVWGISIGVFVSLGYEHVAPRLAEGWLGLHEFADRA